MKSSSISSNARVAATRSLLGALVLLTVGAPAADLPATTEKPAEGVEFRPVEKAVSVIGMDVKDRHGRLVGGVRDLAVDIEHGRVVEVIVSSGGFLGFWQRIVAVPPGAFTFDRASETFRFRSIDRAQFEAAPEFSLSKWSEHTRSRQVAASYIYFAQVPYFAADGEGSRSGTTAIEPLGHVTRASELLHLRVRNLQDEELGTVHAMVLALPKDSISHVIVRGAGPVASKSAIPARSLRFNAAGNGLVLDVTKAAFLSEPRFRWSYDDKNRGRIVSVFGDDVNFQQQTYSNVKVAANEGMNTKQRVEEGAAVSYTPLAQGARFGDVNQTHLIYMAIRADSRLSQTAQDVEVGTVNGRVTLRGHVDTEAEKRAIGAIAEKTGRAENVSNLLEVRQAPVTSNKSN